MPYSYFSSLSSYLIHDHYGFNDIQFKNPHFTIINNKTHNTNMNETVESFTKTPPNANIANIIGITANNI